MVLLVVLGVLGYALIGFFMCGLFDITEGKDARLTVFLWPFLLMVFLGIYVSALVEGEGK